MSTTKYIPSLGIVLPIVPIVSMGEHDDINNYFIQKYKNELHNALKEDEDIGQKIFQIHDGLLFHMICCAAPREYIVYKHNEPIAFVHSRSHDVCYVGNTKIYSHDNRLREKNIDTETTLPEDMAKRINEYIQKVGEGAIGELNNCRLSGGEGDNDTVVMEPYIIQQIQESLTE